MEALRASWGKRAAAAGNGKGAQPKAVVKAEAPADGLKERKGVRRATTTEVAAPARARARK